MRVPGTAVAIVFALAAPAAPAAEVRVAVAANFAATAQEIGDRYARATGHAASFSSGSTGKFYAQIKSGAPFDVLLSADAETPGRLEAEGLAIPGQRFTYALGKLVLWSPRAGLVDERGEVLRGQAFRHLSIANPRLAPYGAAARQAMEKLGVWSAVQERLVLGENIAQAYQFVSTGNAELGFIAYSQIRDPGKATAGSFWLVPQALYAPIRQDAALLASARDNIAARDFLAFLRGEAARQVIQSYGYGLP